ncbi:cytochrome c biogenesis protein ResB [Terribacillus saccharophilus]|uniref:cytochrome c biogenesis protein ResB n=1 Tax=Terribacillus saccharophilus TaxID=361277 RepID=UPI003982C5CE
MQQCPFCKKENDTSYPKCPSCGQVMIADLDMRYEGTVRRSQRSSRNLIDKMWRFFASVRNGMYILLVTLLSTAVGTILPQRSYIPPGSIPSEFYASEYGAFGEFYHRLGLDQLYSTWWYITLLGLLGASILIASIDRFFPLYRALRKQPVKRKEHFLKSQLYTRICSMDDQELLLQEIRAKRYHIRQDGQDYLAEKNRFARWGPYVNHIGLLLVLLGAFLRLFPFFYQDEFMWIRDRETAVVPGTNQSLFIKNERFQVDTYSTEDPKFEEAIAQEGRTIPKSFTTAISVYEADGHIAGSTPDLQLIKQVQVSVNHPVRADGYTIYQSGYQLNEFSSLTFRTENGGRTADFVVDTVDPETSYELENGLLVELIDYYPDYQMDGDAVISLSKYPRNPAFVFQISSQSGDSERLFVSLKDVVSETDANRYSVAAVDYDTHNVSGLSVKRDLTLPIFLTGGFIFMIGLVQGLYWQHRRIWLHKQADGSYLIAGHTNKHVSSFVREADRIVDTCEKGGNS